MGSLVNERSLQAKYDRVHWVSKATSVDGAVETGFFGWIPIIAMRTSLEYMMIPQRIRDKQWYWTMYTA